MAESDLQRIATALDALCDKFPKLAADLGDLEPWARAVAGAAEHARQGEEDPDFIRQLERAMELADGIADGVRGVDHEFHTTREVGRWWVGRSLADGAPATGAPPPGWESASEIDPVRGSIRKEHGFEVEKDYGGDHIQDVPEETPRARKFAKEATKNGSDYEGAFQHGQGIADDYHGIISGTAVPREVPNEGTPQPHMPGGTATGVLVISLISAALYTMIRKMMSTRKDNRRADS